MLDTFSTYINDIINSEAKQLEEEIYQRTHWSVSTVEKEEELENFWGQKEAEDSLKPETLPLPSSRDRVVRAN